MTTIEEARKARCEMLNAGYKLGQFHCLVRPATITKKDWLMCPACGIPQDLMGGADEEFDPAVFRTDFCIRCLFPIDCDDDPAKYNVVAGMLRAHPIDEQACDWMIDRQANALCRYEDAPPG